MTVESKIKNNYDLAALTTFKIGGRAEFFLEIKTAAELISALKWSKRNNIQVRWFAGGSNILVKDGKISGLVIKIKMADLKIDGNNLVGGAGLTLAKAVKAALANSLSGLEWAAGIPGTVGGAIRGNAGAFGQTIGQAIESVEAIDLKKLSLVCFNREQCEFSHRNSIFKERSELIIYRVRLSLVRGQLESIKNQIVNHLKYRANSQPQEPSAGCIFKNLEYKKVIKQNKKLAEDLAAKGLVRGGKIGVGYLIDQLGLKGKTVGGAKISEKHANFIVNTGKASAQDVKKLINFIKKKVNGKFKIKLEEEIQYFGD